MSRCGRSARTARFVVGRCCRWRSTSLRRPSASGMGGVSCRGTYMTGRPPLPDGAAHSFRAADDRWLSNVRERAGGEGWSPMTRGLPFYSVRYGTPLVFHNNDECDAGMHVEPANWRAGDGGRPLCPECARRSRAAGIRAEQKRFAAEVALDAARTSAAAERSPVSGRSRAYARGTVGVSDSGEPLQVPR